ncbi:conserved exported hypothetical protein [Candidatus Nitrotoga sp. HW29]|uniref:hypothetical protein n=1 Tax=Candidatus Nitrotoga sp. HW29 TaxID=2886963 RepID=UPI001EF2FF6D|nr:hypothetical protein [Candidatus Nitrotoga sp. HW29]CAH1903688.1 conserved exported hypothetical protein [Candidatus Nitrotoga sp. HW29]
MRQLVTIFVSAIFFSNLAHARVLLETSQSENSTLATPANLIQQSGQVSEIHANESKMVIGGVTYAYNPLSTKVTVNGKHAAISDVRSGEVVQFWAVPQGKNMLNILTTISVQTFRMQR